ncbi:MAG TPA: hypothetical protein PK504_00880 [Ferruginibacter sp.]|nr:hypothetical protein [Ferruginibacter sp.]HRE62981.1 hypothetical protein [Ferruginibacter sp.]
MLLLLQYSRQVLYLQCKLDNITTARPCDCEKIMTNSADTQNEGMLIEVKIHVPDEWFFGTEKIKYSFEKDFIIKKPTAFKQHFYAQLYRQKLIMPPRV